MSGGKWKFGKAASVKMKDGELLVDTGKKGEKTNLSGLKLKYAPKTGLFKGSFKAFATETAKGKTALRKYTVNVSGAVVNGVGCGQATCKKPTSPPCPVEVR